MEKQNESIRERAYEKYRMVWMRDHNISVKSIAKAAGEWYMSVENDGYEGSFETFLEEFGFGGMIWPCYEEFLGSEYLETDVMLGMLTSRADKTAYLDDVR